MNCQCRPYAGASWLHFAPASFTGFMSASKTSLEQNDISGSLCQGDITETGDSPGVDHTQWTDDGNLESTQTDLGCGETHPGP